MTEPVPISNFTYRYLDDIIQLHRQMHRTDASDNRQTVRAAIREDTLTKEAVDAAIILAEDCQTIDAGHFYEELRTVTKFRQALDGLQEEFQIFLDDSEAEVIDLRDYGLQ